MSKHAPKYESYDYNTMGFANDPLSSNGNTGLLDMIDNGLGGILFGDPDASSSIFGELTGYNAQQREFAQQEYMQDKIWEHDAPAAQMNRMKAAGINLNTAAAGVAGGNVSAPAPAVGSPSSAPGAGLGAIGSFIHDIASANKESQEAKQVESDAETRRSLWSAQTAHELEAAGVDKETSRGLTITNGFLKAEHAQELLIKMQTFENMRSEWQNLEDEHQLNVKKLNWYDDEMQANISLLDKKAIQASKEAEEASENAAYQKKINDFFDKYGFDPRNPDDVALRNLWLKNPDLYYKTLGVLTDKAYQFNRQGFRAEKDFAFSIAYARQNGINASDVAYNRLGSVYDAIGRASSILGNAVDSAVTSLRNLGNSPAASQIRKEVNMVLENAYKQYDEFPEDRDRIQSVIDEWSLLLQLNNTELVQWYNHSKK